MRIAARNLAKTSIYIVRTVTHLMFTAMIVAEVDFRIIKMSDTLTLEGLMKMYDEIRAVIDQEYKFKLPKLDVELDIRDYQLKSYGDMHVLMRRRPRNEPPMFAFDNRLRFNWSPWPTYPAQMIWLQNATPEFITSLTSKLPELLKDGPLHGNRS